MTISHLSDTNAVDDVSRPAARSRAALAVFLLAVSAATIAVLLAITPWGDRDEFAYREVAAVRDSLWTGLLLDGLAFACLGVTLGLVTCFLVTGRGHLAATIGAVLTGAGGLLFALGSASFATLAWYATSPALPPEAGTALLEWAEANPARAMGPAMAGFLAFAVGSLVVAGAMLRSGSIPRPVPVAIIVLTIAQFAPVPARALDVLQILIMAAFVGVAVLAGRAFTGRADAASPERDDAR